jgi:hypothetical protein
MAVYMCFPNISPSYGRFGTLITGFTDLQYSPSTAKVGTQWRDYYDPESGIKQYEVQVEIARLVIILGYSMVIT